MFSNYNTSQLNFPQVMTSQQSRQVLDLDKAAADRKLAAKVEFENIKWLLWLLERPLFSLCYVIIVL